MNAQTASSTQTQHVVSRIAEAKSWFSRSYCGLLASVGFAALLLASTPALAVVAVAPTLGTAAQFGALGNSGVTGSAAPGTVVNGNVGSGPTTPTITNFGPSTVTPPFVLYTAVDPVTAQAQIDAGLAYTSLAGQGVGTALGNNLSAVGVLLPGLYSSGAADLGASTTLTLNDPSPDKSGIFVFNVASSLVMNGSSVVTGTANPCNVYWRVGSSATLNGTSFMGTVIADTSISTSGGGNVTGRLLAGAVTTTGIVTMATGGNTIGGCSGPRVTVTKISNGGIGSFDFTGDNGFAPQNITTLASGTGVAGATQTLTAAGAITTITESAPPAGFALASISCSGLGAGTATPDIVARNVVLNAAATAAGAAIACTFTNTRLPTLTVTKISNGGVGTFSFTGDNGFAPQNITTLASGTGVAGATQTLTAAGAITTITESAPPAGFALASISCSGLGAGTATPDIVARNVVLNAAATAAGAAIACTFTNVAVVPNSITIVKSTVGGNGTFAYTGTNGIAGFNITTASGSGSNAITALAVGSYTINETPVPAGWNLTNLQCLGAATPVVITGGQAVITLAAGEAVVCTYTNTKQGSITIVKNTVGGNGIFNYTGAQSFSITTAGGTGSNTTAFASVVPGTYNVTETVPAGWNLTGLTCSNGSTVTVGTATANVAVAAGEAVTCTFTNNLLLLPPAAGIPTLSEWAMIMLAALLAIAGFAAMRRQVR